MKIRSPVAGRYLCLLMILTISACSGVKEITPADGKYLFVPAEIASFPIDRYWHKLTAEGVPYLFLKTDTRQFGFTGVYGTILVGTGGAEVKYLCIVNIPPMISQAQKIFQEMIPEYSPRVFGAEEAVDPALYEVDEAYLYRADDYFYLILRSSRIVYAVLLDGTSVKDAQVRDGLTRKIVYLKQHVNTIH